MKKQTRPWEILLVEDNPADARLTREALGELNVRHRLQLAEDGFAALKYLTSAISDGPAIRPDLILLDLNLPLMNGLEVLSIVKSSDHLKSIPVIVMSSSAAADDVSAAYRLNANGYTQKPLDMEEFICAMGDICRFWLGTALLPEGPTGKPH
ncbi:MAG: response regulator [Xanthomonadales bacterium]|nr:response regulator [Xanthomonadales bacterium]